MTSISFFSVLLILLDRNSHDSLYSLLISCRSLPERNCLSPTRRSRHSAPPGIPPVTWNVSAFHLTTPCLNSSRKLFPKRVLLTTWRAAQKGDARDSARLSCHVLSPGAQRGRCLAGGCHARLRVLLTEEGGQGWCVGISCWTYFLSFVVECLDIVLSSLVE